MTTEPQAAKDEHSDDVGEPVLALIKQIKENKLNPKALPTEDRRRCGDMLWGEGYSIPETAQILQCSERTIHRDRQTIRASHALKVTPQFALETAGELVRQAEISTARLRRIARDNSASAMERCLAESAAFKVFVEMIGKLQSMGHLPRVPTGVVAQVVGVSGDAIATYEQMAQRLEELERVDQELGVNDPEQIRQRQMFREIVERGRTATEIEQLFANRKEN